MSTMAGPVQVGALVVLLMLAYLSSGRRVRRFSRAASLTATAAAWIPGWRCRPPPVVMNTSVLMNSSVEMDLDYMIVSSVLIDSDPPDAPPRRALLRKEQA